MKHLMTFDIIDHVDGSFDSELEGWEHAQAVANGRAVRLVQSRQVDQDKTEVKDLQDSMWEDVPPNAESPLCVAAWFSAGTMVGAAIVLIFGGPK